MEYKMFFKIKTLYALQLSLPVLVLNINFLKPDLS